MSNDTKCIITEKIENTIELHNFTDSNDVYVVFIFKIFPTFYEWFLSLFDD